MIAPAYGTPEDLLRKRVDDGRAAMALIGGSLHLSDDERNQRTYIASLGPHTRSFSSIDEFEAWLDSKGLRRAEQRFLRTGTPEPGSR